MQKYFYALFSMFMLAMSTPAIAQEKAALPHWTYEEQAEWGELNKAFSTCKAGVQQSPVDIKDFQEISLSPLAPSYKKVTVKVFNNGHTIQSSVPEGNILKVADKEYTLVQLHFHTPSEHRINGKSYPMEMHLVHKDKDGKLAVLGIMLQEGEGNPVIQRIWDYIPEQSGEENGRDVMLNIADLLPKDKHYYTYEGSLTTPPCSENVSWLLMAEPIIVSKEQVAAFAKRIGHNARIVQPLNGRVVKTQK